MPHVTVVELVLSSDVIHISLVLYNPKGLVPVVQRGDGIISKAD